MVLSIRFKVSLACLLGGLALFSVYLFAISSNIRFFVIVSESMKPKLNTGDIVMINTSIDRYSSFTGLKIGDIIAFEEPKKANAELSKIVVHRVVQIGDSHNGDRTVSTKGDANPYPIRFVDFPITKQEFIGKVEYTIPHLGLFLMYIDIILRAVFPPVLYVLGAVVAGILIAFKINRIREATL